MTVTRSEYWTQYGKTIRVEADEEVTEPLQQLMLEDRIVNIRTVYVYNMGVTPLEVVVGSLRIFIQPYGIKPLPAANASTVSVKPTSGQFFDMVLVPETVPPDFVTENIFVTSREGLLGVFRLDNDKLQ
jgi:hypothetical protein